MGVVVCTMRDDDAGRGDSECEYESGKAVWTAKEPEGRDENTRGAVYSATSIQTNPENISGIIEQGKKKNPSTRKPNTQKRDHPVPLFIRVNPPALLHFTQ